MVRVLVQRCRVGIGPVEHLSLVEVDLILEASSCSSSTLAVKHAADAATGVAPGAGTVVAAGAAHDVAELDATGLAVPEADAKEDEEQATECNGEGDGDVAVLELVGLTGARIAVLVKGEVDGLGGAVDLLGAGLAEHESESDVLRDGALEEILADGEGKETPVGGDVVGLVELLPVALVPVVEIAEIRGFLFRGAVEEVETNGDSEGGVGFRVRVRVGIRIGIGINRLVEEVGVPGHCCEKS